MRGRLLIVLVLLLAVAASLQVGLDRTPAGSGQRGGNFPSAATLTRFLGGIRQYLAYTFFIKTDKLYHLYGNNQELIPYFLLTIYLDPHYTDAYYVACGLVYEAGRKEEALDLNLRGVETNPDSSDLYLSLADLYLREGMTEEAAVAFERAVQGRGRIVGRYTFIKGLASVYDALGGREEARRLYLEAVIYNRVRLESRGEVEEEVEEEDILVKMINNDSGLALPAGLENGKADGEGAEGD